MYLYGKLQFFSRLVLLLLQRVFKSTLLESARGQITARATSLNCVDGLIRVEIMINTIKWKALKSRLTQRMTTLMVETVRARDLESRLVAVSFFFAIDIYRRWIYDCFPCYVSAAAQFASERVSPFFLSLSSERKSLAASVKHDNLSFKKIEFLSHWIN